ncbi:MAG: GNAT family N-acetyltransferase [Thermodesulfobacteriota bacterium]
MIWEVHRIGERIERAGVGLKDAMAMLHMTLDDQQELSGLLPGSMFEGLHSLMEKTVRGARVERSGPLGAECPFHAFEIKDAQGQGLGYLNMMYLRKPLRCYYLVYVEVSAPFRGRGLGTRILEAYRDFLEAKGCLGLLDNIIPPQDPTFHIYTKLGYKPVEQIIGLQPMLRDNNYMVWIPNGFGDWDMGEKLLKLLFNLQRKRAVIDMKDNEAMVERTIEEFRSVYRTLQSIFKAELSSGKASPLMRFMFTKFATKLLGFRRRITRLLGYTGGESLEQIRIGEEVGRLVAHPWSLWGSSESRVEVLDPSLPSLPRGLLRDPTGFVEGLPIYRRPYLGQGLALSHALESLEIRISDLLNLGFDPTRLREWETGDGSFVFERSWPRFERALIQRASWLRELASQSSGIRFAKAELRVNPPLAFLNHRGNLYILRRKVEGIHLEEAVDQLRGAPHLVEMNRLAGIDRALLKVGKAVREWMGQRLPASARGEVEDMTIFVPWDLERNFPRLQVEPEGVAIDMVWVA